jgi:ribosomal protein S26
MEKKRKKQRKKRANSSVQAFFCHYCPNLFPIDENILKEKINHHPLSTGQKFELI